MVYQTDVLVLALGAGELPRKSVTHGKMDDTRVFQLIPQKSSIGGILVAAPKKAYTAAHWTRAKQLFGKGLSYQNIAAQLEKDAGRPLMSYQVIRRHALDESWTRAAGTSDKLGPALQTLAEKQKRAELVNTAKQFSLAAHMATLTEQLAIASSKLVKQMFSPHEIIEIKLVAQGSQMGQCVEIVRETISEPTPKDKQALASAASSLIDRLQILTGGVTSRTETGPITDRAQAEAKTRMLRDELAERRRVVENAEAARVAKLAAGGMESG